MLQTSIAFNGTLQISTDNGIIRNGEIQGRHITAVSKVSNLPMFFSDKPFVVIYGTERLGANGGHSSGTTMMHFGEMQDAIDARRALIKAREAADQIRDMSVPPKPLGSIRIAPRKMNVPFDPF